MLNVLNTESRKNSGIIFHLMRAVAGVEVVAKSYVDSLFTHDPWEGSELGAIEADAQMKGAWVVLLQISESREAKPSVEWKGSIFNHISVNEHSAFWKTHKITAIVKLSLIQVEEVRIGCPSLLATRMEGYCQWFRIWDQLLFSYSDYRGRNALISFAWIQVYWALIKDLKEHVSSQGAIPHK